MGRKRIYEPLRGDDIEWMIMFRDNLKFILKTKRSSLKELGRKMGLSYYEVGKLIDGTVKPDKDTIERIADAAGCTVDDLLDESYCSWNYGLSDEEIARKGRRFKYPYL